MLIASMIVKVVPEKAEEVMQQLRRVPNVTTYGVHKENNLIIVAEAHDAEQLENLSKYLTTEFEGVLGVFPTYVTADEEG
ncbi:MAG: chaperone NapD [candidate division KSB1 bacterium]|nr:chaperone NapD [candidate division KSB1 bacterium]MDZ7304855.1 chaperone NapD [candidate division KSB1 bacterium]MDZ7314108.1 chaperone NapD [candidate division KSB1 bacterium]